jgi:Domain of unknown function (DUF397)
MGNPAMNDFSCAGWRKSSYSNSSANCVEVAVMLPDAGGAVTTRVGVRDSKQHGSGPVLEFTAGTWHRFIAGAKAGELPR